ncbi:hypothetical protein E2C01_056517 [Portunus trituberculatus]|uniref:Uncharacterized protein n=1 Tax=Portunus trituberculatus TaxID=210409 RepID=A0A5B7GUC7_PORTR|nr:hypothetical protein [Portunus trituberculatus]
MPGRPSCSGAACVLGTPCVLISKYIHQLWHVGVAKECGYIDSTLGYRDFRYRVLLLSHTHEKLLKFHYRDLRCLLSHAQP